MIYKLKSLLVISAIAAAFGFAGCSKSDKTVAQAAPPPLEVNVLTVKTEVITLKRELPGRVSANRVAQVRARINGIVQKRVFSEGASVQKGDVLFEIDPAPYQASLDSARATLARAEAGLASATAQAERFNGLVKTNAISQQNYDDALASQLGFKADVAYAKALVQTAEINLDYTTVTAPISGRIGRAEVTEGAYVQQATATLLATIQQLDPLYVDLNQSADEVYQLKTALSSGRLESAGEGKAKLEVILGNGELYGQKGTLEFSDVSVNPTTGSITLRGLVPNPNNELLPGMFVRARLDEGVAPNAILIPQSAVSRNSKGEATTMIVGDGNVVELRILRASRAIGNRWLITSGLNPGDLVIVSNLQKIRPGAPVNPVPASESSPANEPQS